MGASILQDLAAGITNVGGGRSGAYETTLRAGRETALREMMIEARALGGNAVIGVNIDYASVSSMLIVNASGTAVVLQPFEAWDSTSAVVAWEDPPAMMENLPGMP